MIARGRYEALAVLDKTHAGNAVNPSMGAPGAPSMARTVSNEKRLWFAHCRVSLVQLAALR